MSEAITVQLRQGQQPLVTYNGENVSWRCASVELLPNGNARLHLNLYTPDAIGSVYDDSLYHHAARQVVEGPYTVVPEHGNSDLE